MPNYKVSQDWPKELKTRIYGLNDTTDVAVKVDNDGTVFVTGTVSVTDFDIRDLTANSDNVQIYGSNDGALTPVETDENGAVAIQDNGGSITVDAVELDIRDLTATSDSVQVFGSNDGIPTAIETDANGAVNVVGTVSVTDFDIRDLTANSDNVQIYGSNAGDLTPVETDANGAVAIQDNGGSITVDAVDLDIRDLNEKSDRVQIFGDSTGNVTPIQTDNNGVLAIQDNGGSITVDATDLDIRDLTATSDSVQVFGFDGNNITAISTDPSGAVNIVGGPIDANVLGGSIFVEGGNVTVDATDLDIRDLTATSDSVQVFGTNDGAVVPIQVDPNGAINVVGGPIDANVLGGNIVVAGGNVTVDADDLDIRDLTATSDNVQIFGYDSDNLRPVLTDTNGVLAIQDNGDSITVDAIDLDIRDLTATSDNVQVYGYNGDDPTPIRTDNTGAVATFNDFTSSTESHETTDPFIGSDSKDVSRANRYSFILHNIGTTNDATVHLEISADNFNWLQITDDLNLISGEMGVLTTDILSEFARVAYRNTVAGQTTTLVINWQASF